MKKISASFLFISLMFSMIIACKHPHSPETGSLEITDSIKKHPILISSFSTSPETDSCSCFFSTDSLSFKRKNYIYAYDLETTAFMKLNDMMVKFTQTEYAVVGNNSITRFNCDPYEMILEIKDVKEAGKEATLQWGSIRVADKSGNVAVTPFYGECGCSILPLTNQTLPLAK